MTHLNIFNTLLSDSSPWNLFPVPSKHRINCFGLRLVSLCPILYFWFVFPIVYRTSIIPGSVHLGLVAILRLTDLAQKITERSQLLTLIWDACRFILYFKWPIERSPLQVYHFALVFSPSCSLIRGLFEQEQPQWITTKPTIEDNWGACVQTLEGHSGSVTSVIFSHDSKLLASASYDDTIRVWDARSGQCLQTLNFGRVVIVK
ncbi:WD40 repeat domain-containing protein [Aspergillus glaucus CBS 516.65]|uniref:Uncharacterized protein n=1 Tax=Aspergillus glaucus CBS 516.65 TaxID=1160497 RepID=A0A1L9V402_ASPGL|nr:hypothetical protein ASPGLDRAFT_1197911 [Aspergillus glaucus CBS 516.65]OJJ78664.1 hypothetical protein ASPGLDRAFT_1197911 [Aspergillus glaucus CBS 516.65]